MKTWVPEGDAHCASSHFKRR